MTSSTTPAVECASCASPVDGRFCSHCGAAAGERQCRSCQADLWPGARFCHQCGTVATSPTNRKDRLVWIVVGALAVGSVGGVAYLVGRGTPAPTVPTMGNAGNAAQTRGSTRPPDISSMTPRQRFDRLFARIAESQSSDTIMMFAPMALSAYQQLDQVDIDARFHAATVHLIVGEMAQAKALADTILAAQPKHLFGYLIRGEAAKQEKDDKALTRSYAAFMAAYEAEIKAGRKEYQEHQPWLDEFRTRAQEGVK
jgi:hypothetical protein